MTLLAPADVMPATLGSSDTPTRVPVECIAPDLARAHQRALVLLKNTDSRCLEAIVGRIRSACEAFQHLLGELASKHSSAEGMKGWEREPKWGTELRGMAEKGYALMADSLMQFASSGAGASGDVQHAMRILELYRVQHLLTAEQQAKLAMLQKHV